MTRTRESDSVILSKYYSENEFLSSAEGILKFVCALMCLASFALYLVSEGCEGSRVTLGGVSLGSGAVLVLLYAGAAFSAPVLAPILWFYTDVVASVVVSVLVLLTITLRLALCHIHRVVDYFHGPIAVASAGLLLASAFKTYSSVMTRLEEKPTERVETQFSGELEV